jgi:hypothetical protein
MSLFRTWEAAAKAGRERPESVLLSRLRAMGQVAVWAGAAGSVALTLRAGWHAPRILVVLFTIWVLSPFGALLLTSVVSRRWSVLTRETLYSVMLIVTLGSLAIYGSVVLGTSNRNPTRTLVLVPPASCLLIAIAISIAALMSRRRTRRSNDS